MRSLSAVVGELISDLAPRGIEGERLRRQLLRLEREIRVLIAAGATGTLSALWPEAAARAARGAADDARARQCSRRPAESLQLDGELIDCDARCPARLITHAWQTCAAGQGTRVPGDWSTA